MDWYYKGGLIVGLIWGVLRALGVYGEAQRDLDLNFLFAFLLTTGGWAAVFLVIDRVAKFFGWKRVAAGPPEARVPVAPAASDERRTPPGAARPSPTGASRRSSRKARR